MWTLTMTIASVVGALLRVNTTFEHVCAVSALFVWSRWPRRRQLFLPSGCIGIRISFLRLSVYRTTQAVAPRYEDQPNNIADTHCQRKSVYARREVIFAVTSYRLHNQQRPQAGAHLKERHFRGLGA